MPRALIIAALLLAGPALAADLPVRPAPTAKPAAASGGGAFSPPDAACLEWTDGCRTCQRGGTNAEPACSNVGIACAPKQAQCTRR
jgi:hypothetical protein